MILGGTSFARSHVHGDPLAPGEDLDGAPGEAHLDLDAREAIGNAVEMALDIDVIIDANPAHAPFGEDIRLDRQRLERRPVEFVKELPTRDAETADRSLVVEPLEQLTHRRVQLGQTV